MQKMHKHSSYLWPGVIILVVAALLRLGGFEESLIGEDQSVLLALAFDSASLRALPLAGIKASVGIFQTAVTSYLAAIPLFVVPKVVAVKWFFSLLDLIAVAWLYRAVRHTFGPIAAVAAAILYAANPWIVEFVRWIWYQSLVPAFATITFSSLLFLVSPHVRKHNLYPAVALLSATLMGTAHLAAMPWASVLLAGTVLLTWLHIRGRRARLWPGLLLGAIGSILLTLPYLIFLVHTPFTGFASFQAQTRWGLNTMALRLSSELITGREVLSTPRSPLWSEAIFHPPFIYELVLVLLALATLWTVWHILRKPVERPALALTLGWTLLAPMPFLLSSGVHLQHFYLLTIFPAPFVLIGVWVQGYFLPSSEKRTAYIARRVVGGVALALLLLLTAWWAGIWGVRIRLEQEGRIGAPTRAWLMDRATEQIQRYLEENPTCQVIIISHFDRDRSSFDWIRSAIHSDRVRIVQTGYGLIIPASCTCYMLGPGASDTDLAPLAGQAVEQPLMSVPAQPPWRFACIPPRSNTLPFPPLAEWRNGLSLLRAEIEEPQPGQQLRITYTWHYREVDPRPYHFFTHLLRNEALVTQSDGPGIPSRYWRNNDLLITRFVLNMPETLEAGEYQMLVGVYSWPDLERVLLVDGSDTFQLRQWVVH